MSTLREEARAWVERALVSAFIVNTAPADPKSLQVYGDALFEIAEEFNIPDSSLIFWIQDRPEGKDWSLGAWRAWCERYADAAAKLPPEATNGAVHREDEQQPHLRICPACFANVIERIDRVWWCQACGEVEVQL